VPTEQSEPGAFVETIGVETVRADQIQLLQPARETLGTRGHLATIVADLPEELVAEVRDFAEFLAQKQLKKQA
jgi:N-acetylglucosamine-6-phosphate deacetylase